MSREPARSRGQGSTANLPVERTSHVNGAIFGITRVEISSKFDEIVGFAEVEKFIDTPVKHYSSGMYVRLAFAVAAHLDQDILFVDEVLAAGDTEFQKRCINKMKDMSSVGRTVLFVSHNITALRNLCSTGLLLEEGLITRKGPVDDVLSAYMGGSAGNLTVDLRSRRIAVGAEKAPAAILRVFVMPVGGKLGEPIRGSTSFSIGVEVEVNHPGQIETFLHCYNDRQQMIFSTGSFFEESLNGLLLSAGVHLFECVVPGHLLADGTYVLDAILLNNRRVVATEAAVLSFQVADDFPMISGWHLRPAGIIRPRALWRCVDYQKGRTDGPKPDSEENLDNGIIHG